MTNRDDFPAQVRRVVAFRAGHTCSNPDCRKPTAGPHSDPEKSVNTGIAAHICAAAPGGLRYDENQTTAERKNIHNAIWLCASCSILIDRDDQKYTKDLLIKWKEEHENYILQNGSYPELPEITLNTINGLTLPSQGPSKIDNVDVITYREHIMEINNKLPRDAPLFECRIQFPEPIVGHRIPEKPVGSSIECKPDIMQFTFFGSGSAKISPGKRPAWDYKIAINLIPPRKKVKIHFYSIAGSEESDGSNFFPNTNSSDGLVNYIAGEFQYLFRGEYLRREFIVPLDFDPSNRKIRSLPICENDGTITMLERHMRLF